MKNTHKTLLAAISVPSMLWAAAVAAQTFTGLEQVSTARVSGSVGSARRPALSTNGQLTVFDSSASNLVSSDTNSSTDVFLQDQKTNTITRISVGPGGIQGDGDSTNAAISPVAPNGFYGVAFLSDAETLELSPGTFPDSNNASDVYFSIPSLGLVERASVGPGPVQADGDSFQPSVTMIPEPNRLLITYASAADNLVSDDSSGFRDIFLTTVTAPASAAAFSFGSNVSSIRISKSSSGGDPSSSSYNPVISGDGRYVVFESDASNLISGLAPNRRQVYLYDTTNGTTTLISRASNGSFGNNASFNATINYNGSYIAYLTRATNILTDGASLVADAVQVVRYNLATGKSERVNVTAAGVAGNSVETENASVALHPGGRYVIFGDEANNLVANDTNGTRDVFVKDMDTGSLKRISVSASGSEGQGDSDLPNLMGAGYTATALKGSFQSTANNLVAGDSTNADVFLGALQAAKPLFTKTTTLQVPADVTSSGKKISFRMEQFSGVSIRSRSLRAGSRTVLQYEARAVREVSPGVKRLTRLVVGKRNVLSLKKLPPGTYLASYRVLISENGRVVRKSKMSPTQRVKIS